MSVLGTVLVVGPVVGTAAFWTYRTRALATLRRMADPTATIVFGVSGFSSRSDLGGGDLSWRAVDLVWAFPEAWLIRMRGIAAPWPAIPAGHDVVAHGVPDA